jgi:hypothetical protein
MCKLKNLYVVDLVTNNTAGGIDWNVSNSIPKLLYNPCKIIVKQMQTEIKDISGDISDKIGLRVIHNMNIQSGYNNGSPNSNILAYIDTYQIRNYISTTNMIGFTSADCILYAPTGLPPVLSLQRMADIGLVDNVFLSWSVRLEITLFPDEE